MCIYDIRLGLFLWDVIRPFHRTHSVACLYPLRSACVCIFTNHMKRRWCGIKMAIGWVVRFYLFDICTFSDSCCSLCLSIFWKIHSVSRRHFTGSMAVRCKPFCLTSALTTHIFEFSMATTNQTIIVNVNRAGFFNDIDPRKLLFCPASRRHSHSLSAMLLIIDVIVTCLFGQNWTLYFGKSFPMSPHPKLAVKVHSGKGWLNNRCVLIELIWRQATDDISLNDTKQPSSSIIDKSFDWKTEREYALISIVSIFRRLWQWLTKHCIATFAMASS